MRSSLLTLSTPDFGCAVRAAREPGGFCWWYLDLVDGQGDGLVFIWSLGLPFLPGVREHGPARPALVVAVYRGGREAFFLFQEYPREEFEGEPLGGYWRFGETEIRLRLDGQVELGVRLDLAVPGSTERLRGTIRARGAPCVGAPAGAAAHVWSPILGASLGSAELSGVFSGRLAGRVYLDHNAGMRPLHELGISRWHWGRLAFSGCDVLWYDVEGEEGGVSVVVEIGADGRLRSAPATVERTAPAWSRYGVERPRRLRFLDSSGDPVAVDLLAVVEASPFYERHLVRGTRGGQVALGFAEIVLPGSLDLPWFRPFVRMRVHDLTRANSLLLPMFSGPREGRWGRMFSAVPARMNRR